MVHSHVSAWDASFSPEVNALMRKFEKAIFVESFAELTAKEHAKRAGKARYLRVLMHALHHSGESGNTAENCELHVAVRISILEVVYDLHPLQDSSVLMFRVSRIFSNLKNAIQLMEEHGLDVLLL